MSFTSPEFCILLTVVCALYWLAPLTVLRKGLLLGASLFFYGYAHPLLNLLLLLAALAGWGGAWLMAIFPRRRKIWLTLGCAALVGLLAFFKYTGFLAATLEQFPALAPLLQLADALDATLRAAYSALGLEAGASKLLPPLGISFYTFQCLGYLIDVYRGKSRAEKNPLNVLLFISFFPQLVAGPIERAHHLLPQLGRQHKLRLVYFTSALPLLLRGLVKKMAIADNLAPFVDQVYTQSAPAPLLLYAGTIAFAVQILCDFSGYTDIARGAARLLGINLMENFRAPYLALNPADFWRRWHISFSLWIRDYLYIPCGGSRGRGAGGLFLVLLITFGLSGLWHGAAWNFVAWGLYHALLVFGAHLLGMHRKTWRPGSRAAAFLCWLTMIHLTLLGWLIFRAPSLEWLTGALQNFSVPIANTTMGDALRVFGAAALYSLPFFGFYTVARLRWPLLRGIIYGLLFCWLVVFASGTDYDFIYFRF